eukprot:616795-Rhodomonas_salina.2
MLGAGLRVSVWARRTQRNFHDGGPNRHTGLVSADSEGLGFRGSRGAGAGREERLKQPVDCLGRMEGLRGVKRWSKQRPCSDWPERAGGGGEVRAPAAPHGAASACVQCCACRALVASVCAATRRQHHVHHHVPSQREARCLAMICARCAVAEATRLLPCLGFRV